MLQDRASCLPARPLLIVVLSILQTVNHHGSYMANGPACIVHLLIYAAASGMSVPVCCSVFGGAPAVAVAATGTLSAADFEQSHTGGIAGWLDLVLSA
jgi:hypothetical protein